MGPADFYSKWDAACERERTRQAQVPAWVRELQARGVEILWRPRCQEPGCGKVIGEFLVAGWSFRGRCGHYQRRLPAGMGARAV